MDRKSHPLCGFVRLQPADAMQPDVAVASKELRPFAKRFLQPIFTKIALTGVDQGLDIVTAALLADCDQLHTARIAPGQRRGSLQFRRKSSGVWSAGAAHREPL